MAEFETVNFFKDRAIHDDPYAYYDWLRSQHPVWQEPNYGVFMVTGHEEAMAVYNDATTYSSCNTIAGPFVKFSVPFEGDDVSQIIDEHRHELPFSDQLPSFDPPMHTEQRGLLMRLITPKR
ncbi:MAG: cytochrome P450, partial [Acidimicrobiia bacterium]|nr:cytochrome P450 [Acidimicrobiia bacterium]